MKGILLAVVVIIVALVAPIIPAQAQTFVTSAGGGTRNGSSWANAYQASQLRQVLANAVRGTVFWVGAGTYKPTTTTRRDSCFVLNDGVRLYGGFAGTETSISQRVAGANVTTLSGNIGSQTDSTDNSRHVIRIGNVDSTTLIDGFTITGGYADDPSYDGRGGGIQVFVGAVYDVSAPTISNCIFTKNLAYHGGAIGFYSGGTCQVRIKKCLFANNTAFINAAAGSIAGLGGAISSESVGANPPAFRGKDLSTIDSCIFVNNTAWRGGGAVRVDAGPGDCYEKYTNCVFRDNVGFDPVTGRAASGGAINISSYPWASLPAYGGVLDVLLQNCRFIGNNNGKSITGNSDPTIDIGGTHAFLERVTMRGCTIDSSLGQVVNLAIYDTCNFKFNAEDCQFISRIGFDIGGNNQPYFSALNARAGDDSLNFTNCMFKDFGFFLTASQSNHIYCRFNNVTSYILRLPGASNTVTFLNTNVNTSGGVTNASVRTDFRNSILWSNEPAYRAASVPATYISNSFKQSIVKNSGGSGAGWQSSMGTDGGGNMDVPPIFRDTLLPDLRPGCGSPAINAGSNALIPVGITTDIDNNPRIVNGIVEMGAYEIDNTKLKPSANFTQTFNTTSKTYDFTYTGTKPVDSVHWIFGDGTTSNLLNPSHNFSKGTYNVCVTVYNACGANQYCNKVIALAVNSIPALSDISIYPNPATTYFTVAGASGATITLSNAVGQLVKTFSLTTDKEVLDISGLAAGVYVLQLTDKTGNRGVMQMVKE
ncbi:MAG: T9SS type A sorting domain-containing protein [Chitinophagaceae bacterium]